MAKALFYCFEKENTDDHNKESLDKLYTKVKRIFPDIEMIGYLFDNHKKTAPMTEIFDKIAVGEVDYIVLPSAIKASCSVLESLKTIKMFLDASDRIEVYCAQENLLYDQSHKSRSLLHLHIAMAEEEKRKRQKLRAKRI